MPLTVDQARARLSDRRTAVIFAEKQLDAAIKARDAAEEAMYAAEEADSGKCCGVCPC